MSLHSKRSLYERLRDRRYREAFISSRIDQTIAAQIKVLRQKQNLSQKDLARDLRTSQNAIYRLENPRYGRPNISTLKKIATFFDVGLIVRFARFSEVAKWTLNMSNQSIEVQGFAEDVGFIERLDARSILRETLVTHGVRVGAYHWSGTTVRPLSTSVSTSYGGAGRPFAPEVLGTPRTIPLGEGSAASGPYHQIGA
jgi:transcriptional regulator with XRE-family HTH domain